MASQRDDLKEIIKGLAQKVGEEKLRLSRQSQEKQDGPLSSAKGATAALSAIKRDLENVAAGLWRGAAVTPKEGLRLLRDKWRKIEMLDTENRRDDWDDGHGAAIRWFLPEIEDLVE
jgi:hypothetical protein